MPRRLPALAVGALLTILSAPALVDALNALSADPVMDALRAGAPVSAHEKTRAASALAGTAEARRLADLAVLLPPTEAEAAAVETLKRRPLDAHTWLRLAHLRQAREAPAAEVAAVVVASMAAAPTDRPLLFARLPLAARAWEGVSPADRAMVLDQAALAWDVDAARVRRLLRSAEGAALLRRMLARIRAPAALLEATPPPGSAD